MIVTRNIARTFALVCLLAISNLLYAAQFIASVSADQVEIGQSLELSLTLKAAKAKGAPDLNQIAQDFSVYSQQQYSTFSSVNGAVSTEAGWDIRIAPNRQGELVIPSIKINTDKGILFTTPLKVQVLAAGSLSTNNKSNTSKSAGQNSNLPPIDNNDIGVSLVASTNKTRTYVKEAIVYTLRIISYRPVNNNATLEDIKSTDAIIDKLGEPKHYDQTIGGLRAHIIEVKYYVTPLVAGKVTIKPAIVRGEVYVPSHNVAGSSHFGRLNNFFIDDQLQFKPFVVSGDEITINTLAPAVKDSAWMPLNNLLLSEEWTGLDSAKVGSSIGRKIKLVATGGFSLQLPSVKQSMEIAGVKTYAESPTLNDAVNPETEQVIGTKEETFAVVPVQAGKITFPAIKVQWWNLRTKQTEFALLPAKTIEVSAAVGGIAANDAIIDYAASVAGSEDTKITNLIAGVKHNKLYALIAFLLGLICCLFAGIIYLTLRRQPLQILKFKKFNKIAKFKSKIKPAPAATEQTIINAAALRKAIMIHAAEFWHAPKDVTLNKLGAYLTANSYNYDIGLYMLLCKHINDEMYAAGAVDLQVLLDAWGLFKLSVVKNKSQNIQHDKSGYINLNPT